jgi:hypothetical protein
MHKVDRWLAFHKSPQPKRRRKRRNKGQKYFRAAFVAMQISDKADF